jgi:hypothetical protein
VRPYNWEDLGFKFKLKREKRVLVQAFQSPTLCYRSLNKADGVCKLIRIVTRKILEANLTNRNIMLIQ